QDHAGSHPGRATGSRSVAGIAEGEGSPARHPDDDGGSAAGRRGVRAAGDLRAAVPPVTGGGTANGAGQPGGSPRRGPAPGGGAAGDDGPAAGTGRAPTRTGGEPGARRDRAGLAEGG